MNAESSSLGIEAADINTCTDSIGYAPPLSKRTTLYSDAGYVRKRMPGLAAHLGDRLD